MIFRGAVGLALSAVLLINARASAQTNYYWNGGAVHLTSSWGLNLDGSGANPTNFTTANQIFNIQNAQSATGTATWTISGTGSRLLVQTGGTFNSGAFNHSIGILELQANALYAMNHTTYSNIGTFVLNAASTIRIDTNSAFRGSGVTYGNIMFNGTANFSFGTGQTLNALGTFQVINTGQVRLANNVNLSHTVGNLLVDSVADLSLNQGSATVSISINNNLTNNGVISRAGTGTTSVIFSGTGTSTATWGTVTATNFSTTVNSGRTVTFLDAFNSGSGRTLTNNGTLNLGNGGTAGAVVGALSNEGLLRINRSDNVVYSANIGGFSTTAVVDQVGSGTTTFTGLKNYAGITRVSNGVLEAQIVNDGTNDSSIGASTSIAANLVLNGGTLRYIGAATTTDRLFSVGTAGGKLAASGAGTIAFTNSGAMGFNSQTGARTLILGGTNAGSNVLAPTIGDNGGATSVVKEDVGTWVLTGANTYSGGTTITDGVLRANNSTGSATGSGAVVVASGGTLSGGNAAGSTGFISGPVSVFGIISPGASTGILHTGTTTIETGGVYSWEVSSTANAAVAASPSTGASGTAGVDHDLLSIAGDLNFDAGSVFLISSINNTTSAPAPLTGFANTNHYSWLVASATGGITGLSNVTIDSSIFVAQNGGLGSGLFSLSAVGSNLYLNFSIVPEPGAIFGSAAFLCGTVVWIGRRRRANPEK